MGRRSEQWVSFTLLDSTEHHCVQGMFLLYLIRRQLFSHDFHFIFTRCALRSSLSEISAPRMAVAN